MKTRAAALAALMMLGACSQAGKGGGAPPDRFAGLDGEILKWRGEIVAANPLCRSQVEGQKCVDFKVACKAERTVTPADQAKGISARVVAAMTWNGFDDQFKHPQAGSRTDEFVKAASGWSHSEHAPVSMSTCADL